ncbi:hypothetical protein ACI2KE_05405 [Pseudomonas monteilii]|jgi:vacuolar-type H+-ATPase subunit H|uniref:hypothetical protein n=1 Tax=Pseudomonas alabamensis TaxID=3064349 RepID=UPI000745C5A3|nr:hypothetical protein [Pseudomonas sp. 22-AL-CL-001]AMA45351.1 hypothetical protein APT63_06730 [Pseudomonas monteilii]MDO7909447.1 hypothetical protein [Pseudomonas sp. 22-AL-CL-001]
MLDFKSIGTPLVLSIALLTISGCDEARQSTRQALDQAAESAKSVIDKTNDVAQQALDEALGPADAPRQPAEDTRDTQGI